jgi:hypothetical protein
VVYQWEETEQVLAATVAKHPQLSTFTETASLGATRGSVHDNLIVCVDRSLDFLQTLYQQLNWTRIKLAAARDRLTSPVCHIPEEILCDIFMDIVFTPAGTD